MRIKKGNTHKILGKKSVRYVSLSLSSLSNRTNSIRACVCCRRCHFIISLFRYASFVYMCVNVNVYFFCLQNGASILRNRQWWRQWRRQIDANIFNSKQHFSVKCQLIDFFSLTLSWFSLFAVCVCVSELSTIAWKKTSNEKRLLG